MKQKLKRFGKKSLKKTRKQKAGSRSSPDSSLSSTDSDESMETFLNKKKPKRTQRKKAGPTVFSESALKHQQAPNLAPPPVQRQRSHSLKGVAEIERGGCGPRITLFLNCHGMENPKQTSPRGLNGLRFENIANLRIFSLGGKIGLCTFYQDSLSVLSQEKKIVATLKHHFNEAEKSERPFSSYQLTKEVLERYSPEYQRNLSSFSHAFAELDEKRASAKKDFEIAHSSAFREEHLRTYAPLHDKYFTPFENYAAYDSSPRTFFFGEIVHIDKTSFQSPLKEMIEDLEHQEIMSRKFWLDLKNIIRKKRELETLRNADKKGFDFATDIVDTILNRGYTITNRHRENFIRLFFLSDLYGIFTYLGFELINIIDFTCRSIEPLVAGEFNVEELAKREKDRSGPIIESTVACGGKKR